MNSSDPQGTAQKNTSKMSSSSEEERRPSEATTKESSDSKVQTAWKAVKHNIKARSSMPNMKRWLVSSQGYQDTQAGRSDRDCPRTDEQESRFCNALLGLMERTGRYDYIDFAAIRESHGNERRSDKEENNRDFKEGPRAKRFSWSR